jgi:hypothetical protein
MNSPGTDKVHPGTLDAPGTGLGEPGTAQDGPGRLRRPRTTFVGPRTVLGHVWWVRKKQLNYPAEGPELGEKGQDQSRKTRTRSYGLLQDWFKFRTRDAWSYGPNWDRLRLQRFPWAETRFLARGRLLPGTARVFLGTFWAPRNRPSAPRNIFGSGEPPECSQEQLWLRGTARVFLGTFLAPGNRPSVPGRTKYSPGSGLASLTVLKIASDLARHKHRLFPAAFLLLSCRFPNDSSSLIPHPLQRWPPALIRSIPLQRSKKGRRVEVTATAGMWESRYGPLRPNKNLP